MSRCFSKFDDFGLICSVVLGVRVFMRTIRIGVFPWTMIGLGCFNGLVCLDWGYFTYLFLGEWG